MEELENMRKKELYLKNHLNFRVMFRVISIIIFYSYLLPALRLIRMIQG